MVYISPAVGEMLKQKPNELEGKDFFDLVFGQYHPHSHNAASTDLCSTGPTTAPKPPHIPSITNTPSPPSIQLQHNHDLFKFTHTAIPTINLQSIIHHLRTYDGRQSCRLGTPGPRNGSRDCRGYTCAWGWWGQCRIWVRWEWGFGTAASSARERSGWDERESYLDHGQKSGREQQ